MMAALVGTILFIFISFTVCDQTFVDPFDPLGENDAQNNDSDPMSPILPKETEKSLPNPIPEDAVVKFAGIKKTPKGETKCQDAYFAKMYAQLIRSVWKQIDRTSAAYGTDSLRADVTIDDRIRHVLSNYLDRGNEKVNAEVNEVFISLFQKFQPREFSEQRSALWNRDTIDSALLLLLLFVILGFGISVWSCVSVKWLRLLWPVFYLSWLWTWIFLYKREVAKRQASMLQTSDSVCRQSLNKPWWSSLGHYLHSYVSVVENECEQYQERVSVDPWLEVNPLMALSHMVVMILVQPAGVVAEAITSFVRPIVKGLPLILSMGVLFISVVIFVIILLFIFQYRFRIPFLFTIEPSPTAPSLEDGEVARMLRSIERRTSAMSDQMLLMGSPASPQRCPRLRRSSSEASRADLLRLRRTLMGGDSGQTLTDFPIDEDHETNSGNPRGGNLRRRVNSSGSLDRLQ